MNTDKIKSLRERRGLTQGEAAKRAGLLTRQAWNNIECGRKSNITLDTLDRIAAALGVKPADLLVK